MTVRTGPPTGQTAQDEGRRSAYLFSTLFAFVWWLALLLMTLRVGRSPALELLLGGILFWLAPLSLLGILEWKRRRVGHGARDART